MLKFVIVTLLLVSAQLASAVPVALSGSYIFKGRVEPLARITYDIIDLRRPGSQQRWEQLRALGAQCQAAPGQMIRCLTYGRISDVSASSLQKMAERHRGLRIDMGALRAAPSVITDSGEIRQWSVPQSFQWNRGSFEQYIFWETRIGNKIVLPGVENGFWLNVLSPRMMALHDSINVTEDSTRWHNDAALVILE